ncbi:TPA: hypothetical protein JBH16_15265, partial [Legionella pneumophila]|nr:hypothetical protein [Legionella pneumophila]
MRNTGIFQDVWLPQEECRLLKQMYSLAGDGLQYLYYKKWFSENELNISQIDSAWYTYTVNGYYDLTLRNWCMLFGNYSEPTHYFKLQDYNGIKKYLQSIFGFMEIDKDKLREELLKLAGLSLQEFSSYHSLVLDYRNRYLSHREHHPDQINDGDLTYPILDTA